jgi:hypothetical protein
MPLPEMFNGRSLRREIRLRGQLEFVRPKKMRREKRRIKKLG